LKRPPKPSTLFSFLRPLLRVLPRILLSPLTAAALLLLMVAVSVAFGHLGFYAVPTGSMEPVIPRGSLIVVERVHPAELKIGDVALVVDRQLGLLVAHRVVGKDMDAGVVAVKGDAVVAVMEVPFRDVIGVVVFHVPYLGFPFLYRQVLIALVALVIVVAFYLLLQR